MAPWGPTQLYEHWPERCQEVLESPLCFSPMASDGGLPPACRPTDVAQHLPRSQPTSRLPSSQRYTPPPRRTSHPQPSQHRRTPPQPTDLPSFCSLLGVADHLPDAPPEGPQQPRIHQPPLGEDMQPAPCRNLGVKGGRVRRGRETASPRPPLLGPLQPARPPSAASCPVSPAAPPWP